MRQAEQKIGDRALTFSEAESLYGIPKHRLRLYRSERTLVQSLFRNKASLPSWNGTVSRRQAKRNTPLQVQLVDFGVTER